MKSHIKFAEEKLREDLANLKISRTEDQKLYKWINRTLDGDIIVICPTEALAG